MKLNQIAASSLLSCLTALLLVMSATANAQQRHALLIANEAYDQKIGVLKQPRNDAKALAAVLEALNFSVETVVDADFTSLHRAVVRHAGRVRASGANAIGFLYYAGHGAAHARLRRNYLIPVDVKEWDTDAIWERSIDVQSDVIDKLRVLAPDGFHFVVLDSCRNELRLPTVDRALQVAGKAFVRLPESSGVLVAYSTQEGMTAPDGGDYAKVLARHLPSPGVEAVTLFRNVQLEVQAATGQQPFMLWSGLQRIYFAPQQRSTVASPPAASVAAQPKTCRLPEFGQESWLRSEVHSGNTGWVGGGRSQPWGCDRVAAAFIAARAIGARNKVEKVSSSERSRKDAFGHVTYNYSCTVRVSWDPLFAERADPKCGLLSPNEVAGGAASPR